MRARRVIPYLRDPAVRRIPDGDWIKLERPDGTAMNVRARELPAFEKLALEG